MKPVYGLCDVEPDFHLSNDVYHMWTFAENDGELELPEELHPMFVWYLGTNTHLTS
ncbi:MAG: hypothetical protein ACLS36_08820 [Streptococcus sp.]